jgi:hypothetical protein
MHNHTGRQTASVKSLSERHVAVPGLALGAEIRITILTDIYGRFYRTAIFDNFKFLLCGKATLKDTFPDLEGLYVQDVVPNVLFAQFHQVSHDVRLKELKIDRVTVNLNYLVKQLDRPQSNHSEWAISLAVKLRQHLFGGCLSENDLHGLYMRSQSLIELVVLVTGLVFL